jgi:hypothetical protein
MIAGGVLLFGLTYFIDDTADQEKCLPLFAIHIFIRDRTVCSMVIIGVRARVSVVPHSPVRAVAVSIIATHSGIIVRPGAGLLWLNGCLLAVCIMLHPGI